MRIETKDINRNDDNNLKLETALKCEIRIFMIFVEKYKYSRVGGKVAIHLILLLWNAIFEYRKPAA